MTTLPDRIAHASALVAEAEAELHARFHDTKMRAWIAYLDAIELATEQYQRDVSKLRRYYAAATADMYYHEGTPNE